MTQRMSDPRSAAAAAAGETLEPPEPLSMAESNAALALMRQKYATSTRALKSQAKLLTSLRQALAVPPCPVPAQSL